MPAIHSRGKNGSESCWNTLIRVWCRNVGETITKYKTSFGRTLTVIWVVIAAFSNTALAQTVEECSEIPDQFAALRDLLLQIQSLATAIAVLLAVLMLTYAGALLIRGTPQSVEKAKRIIVYTIGGLVLVFIAGGMVEWVANILCQSGGV